MEHVERFQALYINGKLVFDYAMIDMSRDDHIKFMCQRPRPEVNIKLSSGYQDYLQGQDRACNKNKRVKRIASLNYSKENYDFIGRIRTVNRTDLSSQHICGYKGLNITLH